MVFSATIDSISIASFATVIGVPVGIASASFSFAFLITTWIIKNLLKTTQNKKRKHNIIVMLARSKLNSIENKMSEELVNNEISHEDFTTIINEEKNYCELKECIRIMKIQRNDTDKNNLIEEGKRKGIDEVIRQNASV